MRNKKIYTQNDFLIQDIIQLVVNIVKVLVLTGIFYELGMSSDICLYIGTFMIIMNAIYCVGTMVLGNKADKETEENIKK